MSFYADRPWVKSYDDFVPSSLEYPNTVLHEYLRETARTSPDKTAILTTAKLPLVGRTDSHLTYDDLNRQSDALASALVGLGVTPGDRVAIVLPNCAAFAIAFFAILKAGGVVSATNPTYPPKRMAYQINDCDAKVIICLSLFYDVIKQIQPETKAHSVIVTNIKEYLPGMAKLLFTVAREKKDGHRVDKLRPGDYMLQQLLQANAGKTPHVDVAPDDLALFQYTGGTTGVSKGAMGTHRAIVCNTIVMQTWSGFNAGHFDDLEQMIYLGAIPMFHAYGLIVLLMQSVVHGGVILMVPNPRDLDELIDIIGHYQPHSFLGVPALYNALNNHPRVQSGDVSLDSLILNVSGSAPLPSKTKEEYDARVPNGIIEGYGLSEAFVAVSGNPFHGEHKIRSVGLPYPDIHIKIVSLDDPSQDVPPGDVGELVVSSPSLMVGYHGMPTETNNALRRDDNGTLWLYTGDIARMDDEGYLYIVDRKKDMALIGGFNVYPTQVEDALKRHPAVLEVGVAAVPHPQKHGQEALKAWIVVKPGQTLTDSELINHCTDYLAQYEIPRRYEFVDEIPKTAVGKTLRRELIQQEMRDAEQTSP